MPSFSSLIPLDLDRGKLLLLIDRVVRWSVALVFVVAAVPKLLDLDGFAATIQAYGMLPRPLVVPMALLLPPLELILAFGLVTRRLWGEIGITAMLALFIAVLGAAISAGLAIDCGCFGPEDPEHDAFSGLRSALVRDLVMVAALAYSFWYRWQCRRQTQQQGV
ncbi:MAG TPA: MauE/DoxX family redox-associated membrane protein [Desulforhopalus sp.]|nr:MauE/DoxX family redox-associated membrane protein [Desulforhopalus sp.]